MDRSPFPTAYSLEATFADDRAAEEAAAAVRDAGLGVSVTVGRPEDERAALEGEMRDELESATAGPGNIGPFTKGMTRGLAKWVPLMTVVGAVVGALFGFIPWPNFDLPMRMTIWAVCGAVAGSTAGFVIGGLARPRAEGEGGQMEAERGVTIGVHSDAPEQLERVRGVLERHSPLRVHSIGPGGPRGPSSEEQAKPLSGE